VGQDPQDRSDPFALLYHDNLIFWPGKCRARIFYFYFPRAARRPCSKKKPRGLPGAGG
jgi:hypothetical protein